LRVVFDVEGNGFNPTKIWVIVCKDIDTGKREVFRNVTDNQEECQRFLAFAKGVDVWIGHSCLEYDLPVLCRLLPDFSHPCELVPPRRVIDTLIVSRLANYSRVNGHSLESYGIELGIPKGDNTGAGFFSQWSQPLEDYCVQDCEITHNVYRCYHNLLRDPNWAPSIDLEHNFQRVVNQLHENGFYFDTASAGRLLDRVTQELEKLDAKIHEAFPPKEVLIREFTPKATKYGTINRSSVPRSLRDKISDYTVGVPVRFTHLVPFNLSSHKQIIEVLNEAGWRPEEKTKTHVDLDREIHLLGRDVNSNPDLIARHSKLKITGWKINEHNLGTLPSSAPTPARLLAKRILLESRRRTLTEWLGLVQEDNRIHGKFYGLGAWTHRMAHQRPNTANIPNEYDLAGNKKLLGKEMRALWRAPKGRLLVGVDAEGIQLRIFAHYIDDKEFTRSLVEGKKEDKSDPHNLNQRILGPGCKSRDAAKRFIFALLLGAGIGKLAQILEASKNETESALERLMERYTGFARLKETIIPADAKKGWFLGLDGRRVPIPGSTPSERRHLCMSGYLQNGEAIVMKKATLKWQDLLKEKNAILVNFVHDEWQTETPNNMTIAVEIAKMQADSLRIVGEELKLKCPLAGSYWNDKAKDYTIGTNWAVTH